jgi:hypothetical protein
MSDERWIVTHATEHGATRMWWVDEDEADVLRGIISEPLPKDGAPLAIGTNTGTALIWLTPGQSLTVERSNG